MKPGSPFLIGLTGSVGMGKSTTAQMFADAGIPVWDADAAVGRLYSKDGAGVDQIRRLFPDAIKDGAVDRKYLRKRIADNPDELAELETVVHPMVAEDRAQFIRQSDAPIILLDIPLLFETGADAGMDMVVVVSTYPDLAAQRDRVLARPDMTPELLDTILEKQIPDAEKRARADLVIQTLTLESAQKSVDKVIRQIREKLGDA